MVVIWLEYYYNLYGKEGSGLNRTEFINILRRCLTNQLSPEEVNEHVAYYEEYIDMQIKKGMSEEEVLGRLGDPRLLAKSILTANGANGSSDVTKAQKESSAGNAKVVRIPMWLVAIVAILLLGIVLVCIMAVTVFALKIAIPVLLIFLLVRIIVRTIKKR